MDNIKKPSAIMRPAPFWSWNDKLDESECRRQIREMTEKGWGSFFMHSRVGLVTPYLSEEWMNLISACADEAQKNGIYAWLYDEDKWPSGYAGGVVPLMNEEFRSRSLMLLKKDGITEDDTLVKEIEINGAVYFICKRVAPLNSEWFNGFSYVDLMNPKAVKAFLDSTHEKYKESVGEYFGDTIPGIFTDEPCYVFNYGAENAPWSEYLPDFFINMKGYDITEHVHKLFFDVEDYKKIRYDYYEACTALFKQSFTKQYYDWCNANNLIFTGHFMSEDSCWYQTQWSGDVMSHYEFMHWPGTDKLGRNIHLNITNKQCASACDQLNKERAFSEVFGCMGGQVSFFERKWIGDWQTVLGINFVNHHLSLYSMRGERKRDYPANLFYQQPWWQEERGMSDYFARICAFASEGKRDVNILLMQPLSSVWSEYSPIHAINGHSLENVYDRPFEIFARRLMESKLDYHIGNENLMKKFGSVNGNKIVVGQHEYGCVLVPPMANMMQSTYDLLQEFSANGGKLIFTEKQPWMIEAVECSDNNFKNYETGRSIEDSINILSAYNQGRPAVIDKITGGNAHSIWLHARDFEGNKRYFFINTNKDRTVKAAVKIPKAEAYGIMDLLDGSFYKLENYKSEGDFIEFDITFAPSGSVLIAAGSEALSADSGLPSVLGCGVMFIDLNNKMSAAVVDSFDCEVLDDNVLLLNNFKLDMEGYDFYSGPICKAWHSIFYKAPDGTPFTAQYSFYSNIDIAGCYAAIEMAENNDEILFNGEPVTALKSKGEQGAFDPNRSWLDVNFTKVPLPLIKQGMNTIVIKGKKINNVTGSGFHKRVEEPMKSYFPTEAEEAYICGDFSLSQISDSIYVIDKKKDITGHNITLEGYPFYAGKVKLTGSFEIDAVKPDSAVFLNFINANRSSLIIKINGEDVATSLWLPNIFDISKFVKDGVNSFEIIFATTLVNCFGPNRISGIKNSDGIGPGSFCDINSFQEKYELFDYGIEKFSVFVI